MCEFQRNGVKEWIAATGTERRGRCADRPDSQELGAGLARAGGRLSPQSRLPSAVCGGDRLG
jgi:hypothetical protein